MSSTSRDRPYDGVAVAVPVTIPYVRYSIKPAHWFLGRALKALCDGAGIAKADIDGVCVASFTLMPDTAVGFVQHVGLSPRWLDHVPMGGAAAVVSLRRAARAVESGDAEIVACLAGDTNHVDSFRQNTSSFSRFAVDAVYPYGAGGPNMSFAYLTQWYMREFGAEPADFGKLCVAQRANALRFPHALFKKPLTLDEYLASRPIADPIRLFDCVMPCAGADAFLVMSVDRAKSLGLPHARVLSAVERHNAFPDDPVQHRGGWVLERDRLYGRAGIGPEDVDVVEVYDDYPIISLMQIEDLGFCGKGEGPDFVRRNSFEVEGSFPLNTSGGQLSVGQAGASGGTLGLVEAIRQVTGRALGAQVEGARHALVSGFGMINFDRGLCTAAAILAAA